MQHSHKNCTCTTLYLGIGTNLTLVPDQSIENAGVAFVKGADERNKFFEKIKDQ